MTSPAPAPATTSLPGVGGWPFLITAFLGRLPAAMVQLGYLMVLSAAGRGFEIGGLAVAAVGLGSAAGAPIVGRLVDRFGPMRVLAGATATSLLAQATFLLFLVRDAPSPALLCCAALVGAANPQVGAVARAHWSHLSSHRNDPGLISRALGYEGAADEVSYVLGPVLASFLVSALGPVPAAVGIIAFTALLQTTFLVYLSRTRWTPAATHLAADGGYGGVRAKAVLPLLACLGVGLLFGGTQTGLTAMFDARDESGYTGIAYGAVGIGSGVASVIAGRLAHRLSPAVRLFLGGIAILAAGVLLMGLPSVLPAVAIAILLGVGAGITLITCSGWMERIAPRHLIATMMTLLSMGLAVGVSVGAATAGQLAGNPSLTFWPVVVAAALVLVAALGMRLTRRG